jgi:hypothetical protein
MNKFHISLVPLIGPVEIREVHEHSKLADQIHEFGFPVIVIDKLRYFILSPKNQVPASQLVKQGEAIYEETSGTVLRLS